MVRVVLVAAIVTACCGVSVAAEEDVLKTLEKSHPRLLLKEVRMAELKKLMASDETLARIAKDVIRDADKCLSAKPLVYEKIGPRLLAVSRDCLRRVVAMALAYRLTGKAEYAKGAIDCMLTVSAFNDWNPSHFLDVAEMTNAVSIGYDWLYSQMSDKDRETIRGAIIEKGLKEGLKVYTGKRGWWSTCEHNWNQVCNGGMIMGALALGDTDADLARQIIANAVKSLPRALASYEPDGAWGEGPGYWGYATDYTVYALAALETALGKDFGLSERTGLSKAGYFPLNTCGPTGLLMNYADSGERNRLGRMPVLFWLAKRYNKPDLAQAEKDLLGGPKGGGTPRDFMWYYSPPPGTALNRPLDMLFRGPVEVAAMRSSWTDPAALFVCVKAGYNKVNHAHLDLGQFELDALGQRWVRDLGSDDYNMPAYFGSKRYTYYRLNSFSHNAPVLDGRNQLESGRAQMVKFNSAPASACAVLDFTSAYGKSVTKALRGVAMLEGRSAVLVQDEFDLVKPCEFAWGITTDADIAVDKNKAVLKLKGQQLAVTILSPAGAEFAVESAEQKPPEKTNAGVRRLMSRVKNAGGAFRMAVLFEPMGGKSAAAPKLKPLAEWEGKPPKGE